jgi:glycosyltransferase involved in cell wall biosynthesis
MAGTGLSGPPRKPERLLLVGGIASSLSNFRGPLMKALIDAGVEVTACASVDREAAPARVEALGARFVPVEVQTTGTNPLSDLGYLRALRRIVAEARPDCVLSYTIKPVIYGSLAARSCGVPDICSMITGVGHAFSSGAGLGGAVVGAVTPWLYRAALAGNRLVFFQNPDDRALFERRGLLGRNTRVTMMHGSGVDVDHYAVAPLPTDAPHFLLIARLIREKGIVEYIEAARRVRAVHPDASFTLVGPAVNHPGGIPAEQVEAWVREGIVRHPGVAEDVRPHLAAANVYVLPSYYREGQPRSVLEAMAMGRPIVTADSPGCRETVSDGRNGLLVRPRDSDSLAAAMLRLAGDAELRERMGSESRAIAESRYDVHRVNAAVLRELGVHGGLRRRSPRPAAA